MNAIGYITKNPDMSANSKDARLKLVSWLLQQ